MNNENKTLNSEIKTEKTSKKVAKTKPAVKTAGTKKAVAGKTAKKKKDNTKIIIPIVIAVAVLLLAAGAISIILVLQNGKKKPTQVKPSENTSSVVKVVDDSMDYSKEWPKQQTGDTVDKNNYKLPVTGDTGKSGNSNGSFPSKLPSVIS